MKKVLLFLFSILASIGVRAEDFSSGGCSITVDGTTATVIVTQQGAFSDWFSTTGNTTKLDGVTTVKFSSASTISDGDINALSALTGLTEIDATGCKLFDKSDNIIIQGLGVEKLTLKDVTCYENNAFDGSNKPVIIKYCSKLKHLNLQNIVISYWTTKNENLLTVTNNPLLEEIDLSGAKMSIGDGNSYPNLDFSKNEKLSTLILARVDMNASHISEAKISVLEDINLNGIILPAGVLKGNLTYTDNTNPSSNAPLHYIGTVTEEGTNYNIEVELMDGGGYFKEFAEAISSSGESNFDKIAITGDLSAQDFKDMETATLPVPKIDFSGRTLADDAAKNAEQYKFSESNETVTNILLPEGWVVDSLDYQCKNLHSVMSLTKVTKEDGTDGFTVDAYVKTPGTLVETVNMAVDSNSKICKDFAKDKVTGIKIAGSLLPSDIASADPGNNSKCFDDNGHLAWELVNNNLSYPNATKATTDFPLAFERATISDIDLGNAYFETNNDMILSAFVGGNLKTVKLPTSEKQTTMPPLCLYNMQSITELCIPNNYKVIGESALSLCTGLIKITTTDDNKDAITDHEDYTITLPANLTEIGTNAFGSIEQMTDVYILATKAPKCAAGAFSAAMTYGNNGFKGNTAHPIQRSNYKNGDKIIGVLHYPNCPIDEEKKYTDTTREYTLADETGATDAQGNIQMWPKHEEFGQSYLQATHGHIWNDWEGYKGGDYDEKYVIDNPTGYELEYQGWHEFVLTRTFNTISYDPQVYFAEEGFVEKDWYTLCIPYDLTKSQLLTVMGVAKDNKYKELNSTDEKIAVENIYPDVRTLTHVSRSAIDGKVTLHLSKNLVNGGEGGKALEVKLGEEGKYFSYEPLKDDDPVIIKGGYPYLVRPYIPNYSGINKVGAYVVSVAEDLDYNKGGYWNNSSSITLPKEDWKIHAVNKDKSTDSNTVYVYEDTDGETACYYHFVGTYANQEIPQYAYYLGARNDNGKHQFFRADEAGMKWNSYSAIITGRSSLEYKDTGATDTNIKLDITNDNDLIIFEGETINPTNAGKSMSMFFDESGNTTGIENITTNAEENDGRIYSINGQYVGMSTRSLPKGIYIKNGKKYVVK